MSKRKYNSISSIILLYRQAVEEGMDSSEAREWILSGDEDPLEKIAASRISSFRWIPWDANQALRERLKSLS